MKYPIDLKTENYDEALARVQRPPYAEDDAPYLRTQRYSLSADYEPADVKCKGIVDVVGTADNLWWLNQWKAQQ